MRRQRLTLALPVMACLLLNACATPLKPGPQPVSQALSADPTASAWAPLRSNLPSREAVSWFDIQNFGPEALLWRLALIDTAVTAIDCQYFIWKDDAVGSLLLERVLAAADRGVRVRLLLDDSFLSGEDHTLLAVDAHPNLEVRIFNPFQVRSENMLLRYLKNLNDLERVNHRMHNKLLIADGTAAIVGGRNIADEYFGFSHASNFRDFDVLTTGEILPDISAGFDAYWNSGWAYPVAIVNREQETGGDLQRIRGELRHNAALLDAWLEAEGVDTANWPSRWAKLAPTLLPGKARLLQDKPHYEGNSPPVLVTDILREQFNRADKEVVGISAYLIPTSYLLEQVRRQTGRGVRIRALTNSLASNNHVQAHAAYRHHRRELLEAGVQLHEFRPDARERIHVEAPGITAERIGLHAKLVVLDRESVYLGTLNLDPRSWFLNTEVGLLIDSPVLAEAVLAGFVADFSPDNSWRVELGESGALSWHSHDGILNRQPAGSFWRRASDFFYGLLPIEDQL